MVACKSGEHIGTWGLGKPKDTPTTLSEPVSPLGANGRTQNKSLSSPSEDQANETKHLDKLPSSDAT